VNCSLRKTPDSPGEHIEQSRVSSSTTYFGASPMNARVRRFMFNVVSVLLLSTWILGQDFKKQVIYQIVTDRFYNGDTTNDNPAQSSGLFDATKTNWHLYWGGDLAGIQAKMSYLTGPWRDGDLDLATGR
jgi:hypothetical protein